MTVWGIVVIFFLIALFILFNVLTFTTAGKSRDMLQRNLISTFSAKFDPSTGQATPFSNLDGSPQIQCPAGKKVNIIGALYNVFDPYGECSGTSPNDSSGVIPKLAYSCIPGVQSEHTCSTSSDCPNSRDGDPSSQFICSQSKCQLNEIPTGYKCNAGLSLSTINGKNYCIDQDICGSNIDIAKTRGTGVPNPYCSPSNTVSRCAIRDATAVIAAKCDGRQNCSDLDITDLNNHIPCPGINNSNKTCISGYTSNGKPIWDTSSPNITSSGSRTGYCGLPFLPGFSGGVPENSSTNSPDPANSNLGYTIHGIYTCVSE